MIPYYWTCCLLSSFCFWLIKINESIIPIRFWLLCLAMCLINPFYRALVDSIDWSMEAFALVWALYLFCCGWIGKVYYYWSFNGTELYEAVAMILLLLVSIDCNILPILTMLGKFLRHPPPGIEKRSKLGLRPCPRSALEMVELSFDCKAPKTSEERSCSKTLFLTLDLLWISLW